ncbi:MAG TPA: hypothetical protein VGC90_09020 [Candidatus Limnocylindrales bacterium]
MPLALLLVLAATLGGAVTSYLYDDDAGFPTRLAYGAATGLAALGLIGFVATMFVGLGGGTVIAAALVVAPMLMLRGSAARSRVRRDIEAARASLLRLRHPTLRDLARIVYGAAAVGLLWLVFDRVLFVRDGSVYTGYVNNLGDLPFHMQISASFAYGQNLAAEDPTYAGTGFAYPYVSDFVAAMLVGVGASIRDAFIVQNMALGLALVTLLHRFTFVLTRDRLAAFIAPAIVLFSGGLGWAAFLDDARAGEQGVLGALASLGRDYTITPDGPLRWGNAITTLLVPQRSLLAGLPLALTALVLLWKLVHLEAPVGPRRPGSVRDAIAIARANRVAVAAGVVTGLLPLVHAHSFIVVFGTAFLLGVLFRQWRESRWVGWAIYVVVALGLALPQVWWTTHASIANATTFFGVELGWDHGTTNPVWFWLVNTGLFIPLAAIAAIWAARRDTRGRDLALFSLTFLAWFAIPNVVKLAPWIWDNIKVLFYAFIGFVPLVALLLARLFRAGSAMRVAAAVALAALVLAGGIDVFRVVSGQTEYQEFDPAGVAIADAIRTKTAPRALILHAPTYNVPVFLTGRRSLLGYTGQAWSRGLDYVDRESDIKSIYAGDANAAALLTSYGIQYVLVSPLERSYMPVNDGFFARFATVAEVGAYRLYEVEKP